MNGTKQKKQQLSHTNSPSGLSPNKKFFNNIKHEISTIKSDFDLAKTASENNLAKRFSRGSKFTSDSNVYLKRSKLSGHKTK